MLTSSPEIFPHIYLTILGLVLATAVSCQEQQESVSENCLFDLASDFSEGLAAVMVGDEWGYIDKTGAFVIEPQFDDVWSFSEGLARVEVGDKWRCVDSSGACLRVKGL